MKKTGFRSANTPGDKRPKRGQNGVFLAPGGKFGQNSRKFPPGRPPPTAPGENPRIFRGEILGFSTVFWRIFPRKTGCFPRAVSPQNRGELPPRNPPEISPGISAVLPCFLRFKIGKKRGKWEGFWGQFGRNFPEFPEISRNSPPGAPGCPPEKPPGI